jgi:hypothetical protein
VLKKLSKSCQKVVKVVKKLYKFKTSGEDDDDEEEEEEEDWWLKDQVATSSHLVKMSKVLKKLTKSCQKVDKKLSKYVKNFVTPGKKPNINNGAIVEKVQWCK